MDKNFMVTISGTERGPLREKMGLEALGLHSGLLCGPPMHGMVTTDFLSQLTSRSFASCRGALPEPTFKSKN
jgi:hypothetical protein